MDKLLWIRGLAGAVVHLLIATITLLIGLLIGVGMVELARVIELFLR